MVTRSPSFGRIAVSVLFALSCFGLLLFLWLSFGGVVPLKPKGYRVAVVMPSAPLLAEQADVRISGVPVGQVVKIARDGRNSRVTIELRRRYAPLRSNVRAVLRRKTLLGEGYLELTPGTSDAEPIPEDGTIPASRVRAPVALDEILSTFDRPTRAAMQTWFRGWSDGLEGRGDDLSEGLGHASPALRDAGDLVSELRRQDGAVRTLVRDTGRTFDAIGSSQARIGDVIRSSRELFATTAAGEQDLAATMRELPPFLSALQSASQATQRAAVPLTPLLRDLRPAARRLPSALAATEAFAPELRAAARPLDRVIAAAPAGLGAASEIVQTAGPLVDRLYPLGRQLVPMVDLLYAYRQEATSFAKTAAATQAKSRDPVTGKQLHYLRAPAVFPAEPLTVSRKREPYNRANAYMAPGGIAKIQSGPLEAFDCRNTKNPVGTPGLGSSPPCVQQQPWRFQGKLAQFPRLEPAP